METQEAIRQRRSVKHFNPEHRMTEAEIDLLLDLVAQSPTSFNMQNQRLVLVNDPELRQAIRAAAWNQAQVTDASLLVVICADLHAPFREPERYWANAPEEIRSVLVPMIPKFYQGSPQLQRDEAMRTVGIVGQTLMLAAKDMGYDSCPMVGFDPLKVAELIGLPDDHVIGMMVAVGQALKPAMPKGGYLPREVWVKTNRF